MLVAVLYPIGYWLVGGCAALRSQTVALLRGPRGGRVVWDIPRESLEAGDDCTEPVVTGATPRPS